MNVPEPGNSNEKPREVAGESFERDNSGNIIEKKADIGNEKGFEMSSSEDDNSYAKIISKVKSDDGQSSNSSVSDDAKELSMKMDSQSQIQHLIDVAMERGVLHSIKVAKHFEDNYVLDTFHDRLLADELHDALIEKGLIEKE